MTHTSKAMFTKFTIASITFMLLSACSTTIPKTLQKKQVYTECVILLHGMGRTSFSMRRLEKHLLKSNYTVVNFNYPSTSETIEHIAKFHIPAAITQCQHPSLKKIHFVTHSLGGIVVRQYLQTHTLPEGSRVVMLSPPNQGSEVADWLKPVSLYQWLTGPAGQQLTTDHDSLPNRLAPVHAEIGVIAGTKSIEPWFSWCMPGKNDGKVSVLRAKLKEMKDFLEVPHTHTFIMNASDVIEQVEHFLIHGTFSHFEEPKQIKP